MKFDEAIAKCKPMMYKIFNSYNIDGYDSDDLFQEAIIWILRDWAKILSLENCEVTTAIVSRARWVCDHLKFYNPTIRKVPVDAIKPSYIPDQLTEMDLAHLLYRAKNKLSPRAFQVFILKIKSKNVHTRREIQKHLQIGSPTYEEAIKEVKEFLYAEGIRCTE